MDERWWTRVGGAEVKGPFSAASVRDALKSEWLPPSAEVSLDRVLWASAATHPELQRELQAELAGVGGAGFGPPGAGYRLPGAPLMAPAAPVRSGAVVGVTVLTAVSAVFWGLIALVQVMVAVGAIAGADGAGSLAVWNLLMVAVYTWITWGVWHHSPKALSWARGTHFLNLIICAYQAFTGVPLLFVVLPVHLLGWLFAILVKPSVIDQPQSEPRAVARASMRLTWIVLGGALLVAALVLFVANTASTPTSTVAPRASAEPPTTPAPTAPAPAAPDAPTTPAAPAEDPTVPFNAYAVAHIPGASAVVRGVYVHLQLPRCSRHLLQRFGRMADDPALRERALRTSVEFVTCEPAHGEPTTARWPSAGVEIPATLDWERRYVVTPYDGRGPAVRPWCTYQLAGGMPGALCYRDANECRSRRADIVASQRDNGEAPAPMARDAFQPCRDIETLYCFETNGTEQQCTVTLNACDEWQAESGGPDSRCEERNAL